MQDTKSAAPPNASNEQPGNENMTTSLITASQRAKHLGTNLTEAQGLHAENRRTLLKEAKDRSQREHSLDSVTGQAQPGKMVTRPKMACKSSVTLSKPSVLFCRHGHIGPKIHTELQGTPSSQTIWGSKIKAGGPTLPRCRIYCVTEVRTACCLCNTHRPNTAELRSKLQSVD